MVFPVESEDRALRNLLMLCQDHARLVVEAYRKVLIMIDKLVKGEASDNQTLLGDVEKIQLESLEVKRSIIKELHDTGNLLFNRPA